MKEMKCPYCNSVITSSKYTEVLSKIRTEEKEKMGAMKHKLELQIKEHYEKHFAAQRKSIEEANRVLQQSKKNLEVERKKIKATIESEEKKKYKKIYENQLQEHNKKLKGLDELRNKLNQDKKNMRASLESEIKLKYGTQLQKQKNSSENLKRQFEQRDIQRRQQIDDMHADHNKTTRKLEQTIESLQQEASKRTIQEIGDISEEQLLELLKKEFPEDTFERFRKGRAGGDVIQTIMLNGQDVGKILYENKHDMHWKYKWIDKIKTDRVSIGTTYAILVTKTFPSGMKHFGIVKGIPVVNPRLLSHVARIIRESIKAIEKQKLSEFEKEKKISVLYNYLSSSDFKSSVSAIGDSIERLNQSRMKEISDHNKTWATEERELKIIAQNVGMVKGNVENIIEKEEPMVSRKKKLKKRLLHSLIRT